MTLLERDIRRVERALETDAVPWWIRDALLTVINAAASLVELADEGLVKHAAACPECGGERNYLVGRNEIGWGRIRCEYCRGTGTVAISDEEPPAMDDEQIA